MNSRIGAVLGGQGGKPALDDFLLAPHFGDFPAIRFRARGKIARRRQDALIFEQSGDSLLQASAPALQRVRQDIARRNAALRESDRS